MGNDWFEDFKVLMELGIVEIFYRCCEGEYCLIEWDFFLLLEIYFMCLLLVFFDFVCVECVIKL